MIDPESVLMVSCALCWCDLLGESQDYLEAREALADACPPRVAGRIDGRPYCGQCRSYVAHQKRVRLYRELRGLPT